MFRVVPHKKLHINKLQRVQNYAARIITGNFDYINTHSIDFICSFRFVNVQERCVYLPAVLMFNGIHGLTPMYMTDNIVMIIGCQYNSDVLKRSFINNDSVICQQSPWWN